MYVIGGIDDQISLLVWQKVSSFPFGISGNYSYYAQYLNNFLRPLSSNQPILTFFLSLLLSFFSKHGFFILVLLTVLLNLCFSYIFFKKYKYGILYTLIFSFGSYFWAHLGIHIVLSQIWILPLFFHLLSKFDDSKVKLRNILILSIFITFSIGISNYLGFFILIYFTFYSFLKLLFTKNLIYIKNFFLISLFSGALSLLFLFPYIKASYFAPSIDVAAVSEAGTSSALKRPYEDFFHFSSRPWYFFMPPVKNPWLGELSQNIITKIEATNYFLADDYFAGEHSANYFGIAFLISVTTLSIIMLFNAPVEKKTQIAFYWLLNFLLCLFMMPPFFTISGIKFFTPGELMFRFFSMFRVTTRMAPLLLLNFLIILATSVDYLSKKQPLFFKIFIPILATVTLMETFIPPKIVYYNQPPEVYSYLGEIASREKFAVYPYSQTDEAFFWIDAHKGYLLNVRGYKDADYNSEELTKSLPTEEGIATLKGLGGKYLVVYKNLISPEDLQFFLTSADLAPIQDFSNSFLFTIR